MSQQPVITKKAANALNLQKNGSYSNEGNVLQHTLYDSAFFANTTLAPQTSFFTVPQGGAKTLTETNLSDSGKLPNGQTFLIEKVGICLKALLAGDDVDSNVVLAAFYNIIQNSIFEVKIAGREYDLQLPGSVLLAPIQTAARGTVITATDRPVNTGNMLASGWFKLGTTPIAIGNLTSFSVVMKSGSGNAAIATILNTASAALYTQLAQIEFRLGGILTRMI